MQLDATVYNRSHGNESTHVGVHLFVHQPKCQWLVPNQRLATSVDMWVCTTLYNVKKTSSYTKVFVNGDQQNLADHHCPSGAAGRERKVLLNLLLNVQIANLVMALSISDRCLPSPSVGQGVNNVPHIPVLVPNFLQDLWWTIKQTKRDKKFISKCYSVIIFYNINNIWMKRTKLECTELECSIIWVVLSRI